MLVELEVERARLAFNANIAAILRKQFGLERAPRGGYRALPRIRVNRMEQMVRVPVDVEFRLLRMNADGTVTIEFELPGGRIRRAIVPQVSLQRYARKRGARKA
jgi:hypothetical protein